MTRSGLSALLLLALAASACTKTAPSGPSAVLTTAPVADLAAQTAARFARTSETGNRHGLRIDPPGHHFATFLCVGTLADDQLDQALDAIAASCAAHVTSAGGTMTRPCGADLSGMPGGLDRAVLSRVPAPDAALRGRHGVYRIGDREGWITVLAVRDPDQANEWRIGGAFHEAP